MGTQEASNSGNVISLSEDVSLFHRLGMNRNKKKKKTPNLGVFFTLLKYLIGVMGG